MNKYIYSLAVLLAMVSCTGTLKTVQNPILPGFNPDPSICRVGEDYYLTTSSFAWYPGMPVYHSRDLVNWELISHALDRPGMIDMEGMDENDVIWASTIRYHDGTFYLISNAHKCGGNFILKASDPKGPWSDPVWIKDSPGIDGSITWDDDGRCWYVGNRWDFKEAWKQQCAVWAAEIDLETGELGEKHFLTYGHASNARCTEAPHIYKIDGRYMLLCAEGGSGDDHSVTIFFSDKIEGPYVPSYKNPVLTSRHLGAKYPIQATGHADLVQTPDGEWWGVCLGTRPICGGYEPIGRETFLFKVDFENGQPVCNYGKGFVTEKAEAPKLAASPVAKQKSLVRFAKDGLDARWHCVRIPKEDFWSICDAGLELSSSAAPSSKGGCPSLLIQRVEQHRFSASCELSFVPEEGQEAGIAYYRTADGYCFLARGKDCVRLLSVCHGGPVTEIAREEYSEGKVVFAIKAKNDKVRYMYGKDRLSLKPIGEPQSVEAVASDGNFNKFNGTGVGMLAINHDGVPAVAATYKWFRYKSLNKKR